MPWTMGTTTYLQIIDHKWLSPKQPLLLAACLLTAGAERMEKRVPSLFSCTSPSTKQILVILASFY